MKLQQYFYPQSKIGGRPNQRITILDTLIGFYLVQSKKNHCNKIIKKQWVCKILSARMSGAR